jgi:hypothetical protein
VAERCPHVISSDYVSDPRCHFDAGHDGDCLFGAIPNENTLKLYGISLADLEVIRADLAEWRKLGLDRGINLDRTLRLARAVTDLGGREALQAALKEPTATA